jgi:hypothetical protein
VTRKLSVSFVPFFIAIHPITSASSTYLIWTVEKKSYFSVLAEMKSEGSLG